MAKFLRNVTKHTIDLAPTGARGDVPWIGIVITDGESNYDPDMTIPEANNARDSGVIMFAVGIGDQVSQNELIGIGNTPSSDFVFNADDFATLPAILDQVVTAACQVVAGEIISLNYSYEELILFFLLLMVIYCTQKYYKVKMMYKKETNLFSPA